jgi:tRNA(fMet)-specific endonuclease VapC
LIVLVTDVLSIVQRSDGSSYDRLVERLDAADDEVVVSIVSFEEQMRGWLAYIAKAKSLSQEIEGYARLHAMLDDFSTLPVIDFDQLAAAEFGRLTRFKLRIGAMDLRIAAITLAQRALLLSKNLVDFRKVPGLRVEDWTV